MKKSCISNPVCELTIWLSWVEKRYISEAARNFSQFVIEYFSQAEKGTDGANNTIL